VLQWPLHKRVYKTPDLETVDAMDADGCVADYVLHRMHSPRSPQCNGGFSIVHLRLTLTMKFLMSGLPGYPSPRTTYLYMGAS